MKISKAKLRQIIKEEIGRLDRADEPRGGWPTSRGPRKRPLGDPAPGGEEDEDDRDLLAMQHDATEEQEAWRDSIEEAEETVGLDELNKAMDIIESAYKNEATRETAQQVVDELYRRFGRHEPSPEELEL